MPKTAKKPFDLRYKSTSMYFDLVLCALMTAATLYFVSVAFAFQVPEDEMGVFLGSFISKYFIIALLLAAALHLVFSFKKLWLRAIAGLVALINFFVIFVLYLVLALNADPVDFFYWLPDYIYYLGEMKTGYDVAAILVLCAAVTLIYYIAIVHYSFYFIATTVCLITTCFIYSGGYQSSAPGLFFTIVLSMLCFLISVFKNAHLRSNKNISHVGFSVVAAAFLALMFIIASNLYSNEQRFSIKWLDDIVYGFQEQNTTFHFGPESLIGSNFSVTGGTTLGGPAGPYDIPVLTVKAWRPYYLRGGSLEYYSGTTLTTKNKTFVSYSNENNSLRLNEIELAYGIKYISPDGSGDHNKYMSQNDLTITFEKLNVNIIFAPNITRDIKGIDEAVYVNSAGDLSLKGSKGKSFSYMLTAMVPRYGDDNFKQALRRSHKNLYDEDTDMPQEIKDRTNEIYNTCLQKPASYSNKVRDLTLTVVRGKTNRFDQAAAIEEYLARNYSYDLNALKAPAGKDFVEYFLFDDKRGYCTYFSTAMMMMCRSVGIPARCVTGYIMTGSPDDDRNYTVSNAQAHQWVEVYFEGYGWLEFEPTANYYDNFHRGGMVDPVPNESSIPPISLPSYDPPAFSMPEFSNPDSNLASPPVTTADPSQGGSGSGKFDIRLLLIILGIIVLIVLLTLYVIMTDKLVKKRYDKLMDKENREAILGLYTLLMRITALCGFKFKSTETPYEYLKKVTEGAKFLESEKLTPATDIFVAARYSKGEMSDLTKQQMGALYLEILELYKKNTNFVKYCFVHYILGRI